MIEVNGEVTPEVYARMGRIFKSLEGYLYFLLGEYEK